MKVLSLTATARRRLDEVAAFSAEHFGQKRGDAYVASLLARTKAVAGGRAHHQSCRAYFADDLRVDLRLTRAEQHFIIFVETPTTIILIEFIHQSADVGSWLARSTQQEPP